MKKIAFFIISILFSLNIVGAPDRGKPWDVEDSNYSEDDILGLIIILIFVGIFYFIKEKRKEIIDKKEQQKKEDIRKIDERKKKIEEEKKKKIRADDEKKKILIENLNKQYKQLKIKENYLKEKLSKLKHLINHNSIIISDHILPKHLGSNLISDLGSPDLNVYLINYKIEKIKESIETLEEKLEKVTLEYEKLNIKLKSIILEKNELILFINSLKSTYDELRIQREMLENKHNIKINISDGINFLMLNLKIEQILNSLKEETVNEHKILLQIKELEKIKNEYSTTIDKINTTIKNYNNLQG